MCVPVHQAGQVSTVNWVSTVLFRFAQFLVDLLELNFTMVSGKKHLSITNVSLSRVSSYSRFSERTSVVLVPWSIELNCWWVGIFYTQTNGVTQ